MLDRPTSRRHALYRALIACWSCLWSACEGPAALPVVGADPDDSLAALEAETGHEWTLRRHPVFGTPAFLDGRTHPMAATPGDAERAARYFLSQHRQLFALSSPDEQLATVRSETDELGMTHTRFVQRVGRIPVWGSHLSAHFDRDGTLVHVVGRYALLDGPSQLEPSLTADEARVGAAVLARAARPDASHSVVSTQTPELVIFPIENAALPPGVPRPARLAWHVIAAVEEAQPPLLLDTIFDANDGHLLGSFDRVQTMDSAGVGVFGDRKPLVVEQKKTAYWLEDRSRGATPLRTFSAHGRTRLPGSELRSSDPQQWDVNPEDGVPGAAVDAHAHLASVWDYFEREHGRSGWDGAGTGMRAVVHFGNGYANAFFDGSQLVFGDGDVTMTAPSAALDVVAHEYTHGVVAASAGLFPTGESGAIDEGLADVFGCLVAWTSGQGARWQIGETIYHPDGRLNRALRDLEHPHLTGQPESVSEIQRTDDDQGGVHTNASIVGHLAYLLVEGAEADQNRPRVAAIGVTATGKLFYRAVARYLFPRAGFAELADALTASAKDLNGELAPPLWSALQRVGLR